MTDKEYWIFADESEQSGLHYSNFFGGIIIDQSCYQAVRDRLIDCKGELGLGSRELKWQKVSEKFESEYRSMIDAFFQEIDAGHMRMRVMFRKNTEDIDRKEYRKEERYTKLYYQFIKHAFGLQHAPLNPTGRRLRIFLDDLPDTKDQIRKFKDYLAQIPKLNDFAPQKYQLDPQHISEIDSKDYIVLQCLDIVLGSMAFRLNDKHLVKPEGSRRRGKKTIVKERLYKYILSQVRNVNGVEAFDPKVSTGGLNDKVWLMPYRNWKFRSQA